MDVNGASHTRSAAHICCIVTYVCWANISCCLQLAELMSTSSLGDADKAAKGTLFMRLVEVLPRALQRRAGEQDSGVGDGIAVEGTAAVLGDLLAAIRQLVAGRNELHQGLFRLLLCPTAMSPKRV